MLVKKCHSCGNESEFFLTIDIVQAWKMEWIAGIQSVKNDRSRKKLTEEFEKKLGPIEDKTDGI